MPDLDLNELERLAKAATPGPWSWYGNERLDPRNRYEYGPVLWPSSDGYEIHCRSGDAHYIAAANPETVLALIARVRELETENDRLADELIDIADLYKKTKQEAR